MSDKRTMGQARNLDVDTSSMASDAPGLEHVGPAVPFDSELEAALTAVVDQLPRFDTIDRIPQIRAGIAGQVADLTNEQLSRDGRLEVTERTVPGPQGAPDIGLLFVRPKGAVAPTPALYYTHGGGMILGNCRLITEQYLDWVEEFGLTLVSVEYRLAPETMHPGPVEDAYAGLVWTAQNAAEIGIDPNRILIIGGSAGGGIAAATALLARDRAGPKLTAQMLMCPMLDDRMITASAIQEDGRGTWDRTANRLGWTALLGDECGGPPVSPYAAPARVTDFTNFPPTYIDVGSAELFRDESVAYASAIWRAGGNAELHVFAGGFHGYDGTVPHARISEDTAAARRAWLGRHLRDH